MGQSTESPNDSADYKSYHRFLFIADYALCPLLYISAVSAQPLLQEL